MPKTRRRTNKGQQVKSTSQLVQDVDLPEQRADENTCPSCALSNDHQSSPPPTDKESWIQCDYCRTWYHWRCAGDESNVELIDKWFCFSCLQTDPKRAVTLKQPTRKSVRKRAQPDYAKLDKGILSATGQWTRYIVEKPVKANPFKHMDGHDVSVKWLQDDEDAMKEPIIVEQPNGLEMEMPPADTFTVDQVAELVGADTPVEVIDVATQSTSPGWTVGKWAQYFKDPSARERTCNVISLEISETPLGELITPPKFVRELGWVENYWPAARKGKGHMYPKVQTYCLMGVATAWTDWHIDFAGSSVYYHILRGFKVFYFIRPTPSNLAAYERWSGTALQTTTWLGDMVDDVYKVELRAGNTMIIPTGWIHAVYTPEDTLVFGGNFLHSYDAINQFRICEIESATQVPRKFRFPLFTKLCWYVGEQYLKDLKGGQFFPDRVLRSLVALANYLVVEARTLERGSDAKKKEAKENVPSDKVKDASALARELRWRATFALGNHSDEDVMDRTERDGAKRVIKRKRMSLGNSNDGDRGLQRLRNYEQQSWDDVIQTNGIEEEEVRRMKKPDGNWMETWMGGVVDGEDGEEMRVRRRRQTLVKVRKTVRGMEGQRVERICEQWMWR